MCNLIHNNKKSETKWYRLFHHHPLRRHDAHNTPNPHPPSYPPPLPIRHHRHHNRPLHPLLHQMAQHPLQHLTSNTSSQTFTSNTSQPFHCSQVPSYPSPAQTHPPTIRVHSRPPYTQPPTACQTGPSDSAPVFLGGLGYLSRPVCHRQRMRRRVFGVFGVS